jgi:primosomal protein N' (replication factor Y) (superfamily II helicase)
VPSPSRPPARSGRVPAEVDPVARLLVDVPLPHLDRPFDYLVPSALDAEVQRGSRVRVRFAGRLVDAYVLDRSEVTEHPGALAYIERSVGGEPVLSAETAALFRAVADRWGGNFVDVVRLGVPSRHARAETSVAEPAARPSRPARHGFGRYRAGAAFLTAVAGGRAARAVWAALPGEDWPARLAEAMQSALASGRGAVAVVPDARDLARLAHAAATALGPQAYVTLSADLGPAERYRRWLAVRRGAVRAVVGTRAAAYAPVAELGLLAIWDDGDDLYDEPRAPYAHTRDVLVLRSSLSRCALLVGGFARTADAQQLLESGWAHEIAPDRATLRTAAPRLVVTADDVEQARDPGAAAARLPSLAWRTTREALQSGSPVLVQVPRRGYVPALACVRDRTPARCSACAGPLAAPAKGVAARCRWCGRPAGDWRCPACGGRALRAVVTGEQRTAEELGRAFPGTAVRTSGAEHVLAGVEAAAQLVVATPGAEPVAQDGYGAALLLDGWALLARADLRAGEEALRRWMTAAALVRPGGTVVVAADAGVPAVQALVRWDPGGFAARELDERAELGFPPAVRMASLTGAAGAVADLLAAAELPDQTQVIGPVPADHGAERILLRVPRPQGTALAAALKTAAAARSARKAADPVKAVLDPLAPL